MLFILAKTLDLFLSPLTWALVLGGAGLLLRRRRALAGLLSLMGFGILYLFSLEPVARRLERALERMPARTFQPGTVYDAVIVLGGALDAEATQATGRPEFGPGVERILAGFDLLRSGAAANALISGGLSYPVPGVVPEADVLKKQLQDFGIGGERVFVEDLSRDTHENALYSASIIRAHGWKRLLLVTSAFHMARASDCFRAVGLAVDTYPVHFHLSESHAWYLWLLPRSGHLAESTDMLHELAGREVYRLLGYTAPSPAAI